MARQKKNKSIQVKEKVEVNMTAIQTELDLQVDEVIDKQEGLQPTENDLELLEQELDRKRVELENTKRLIEEKKHELKNFDRRVVTEDEKVIIEKQVTVSAEKKAAQAKIERMKAHDNVMVTGRFLNLRNKGQSVKLPYFKYEDDPPAKWHEFEDGRTYTIKRGFADQINGGDDNCPCYYTPQFTQREGPMDPDKPESQVHAVDTSNRKYAFVAVGFN